jgi:hypothetical protein
MKNANRKEHVWNMCAAPLFHECMQELHNNLLEVIFYCGCFDLINGVQFCRIFLVLCRHLPYSVTEVEALAYEEIQKKLNSSIRRLQDATLMFLHRIVESRHLIPYGMLYIAKVLHNTLMEKFPTAPEKEILKVNIEYCVISD